MQSLAYITLDLQDVNASVVVSAKQNDRLSRSITAQLRDGGVAWAPGSGVAAAIRYRKPDGTAGFYDTLEDSSAAYSINGSVIVFTLTEQMLTVPGEIPVEINFYSAAGEKLTTFVFFLRVQASVLSDAEIISEDYINVLTSMIAAAEAAADRVEAVAGNLPVPATDVPLADSGSGAVGSSALYSRQDHIHPLNVSADSPMPIGEAAPGSSNAYARSDHSHPAYYRAFNSVTQLGLDAGNTNIGEVWAAMPAYSIAIFPRSEVTDYPVAQSGNIEIVKTGANGNIGSILFRGRESTTGDYRQYLTSAGVPSGAWERIGKIRDFSLESVQVSVSIPLAVGESKSVTAADQESHRPAGYTNYIFAGVLADNNSVVAKGFGSPYFINVGNNSVTITSLTYRYLCWNE